MFETILDILTIVVGVIMRIGFFTFGIVTVWAIIMIIQDIIRSK